MSRIGRKPVALPSGVSVTVQGATATVKGPKGTLSLTILPEVSVAVEGEQCVVSRKQDTATGKARHGLTRALLHNMVHGVSTGYEKKLEIIGVGYKAVLKGKAMQLHLGFSHPVDVAVPEGIEVAQDEKNKNIVMIRGVDKQLVGQFAADVRRLRPPEPYKGKGIRYMDETVRRKVGKAATAKAAA